ncbi:TonB-dependent receptor [Aquimarina sp. ERC-38]|uniref:TonB-dependent receptor plug domain-containing protein n=1 Tax=Aquimarina sp. ERC-38 TaxID=2949996 RepID=UPI002245B40C|nr:TonB-dependent receptor [Aquimarina sp. ERC-38]UZO80773.1 TonB-dependent receptor [Aquimarina sp. ERC-38]
MMKRIKKFLYSILGVGCSLLSFGQEIPVNELEAVFLKDRRLTVFSDGFKKETLTDSTIQRNNPALTDLLRYNSTLYFRENGIGGTSSASFRGTSAAQTAVIWNGININSQLNGQTDFNTIRTGNLDEITIRSGGGSVQFGSGAIGGSVHLTNTLDFNKHFDQRFRSGYGSFATSLVNYKASYGTSKSTISGGMERSSSDNDFDYLTTNFKNQNGDYQNYDLNLNVGHYISKKDLLKFHHNTFIGDRGFSGVLSGAVPSPSNDFYEDRNSRTIFSWQHQKNKFTSTVSTAFLYENYRYYADRNSDDFDFGKSRTYLGKYTGGYTLSDDLYLEVQGQVSYIQGEGTNFFEPKDRSIYTGILTFKHEVNKNFSYTAHLRQEENNAFKAPLLYSFDATYKITPWYHLQLNTSRNYRIPTYNDLFWGGPGGEGNPDLIPETSVQGELVQGFHFKNLSVNVAGYLIDAKNLIQWRPLSGTVWSPVNVASVRSYGMETTASYLKKFTYGQLQIDTNYAYTVSENQETDKQLIYVPMHKVTASLSYAYKKLVFYYQFLYNAPVFLTTDNTRELAGYDVSNVGIGYHFSLGKNIAALTEIKVANLYNEIYQNVGFRPMPPRNYQLQITLNL